MQVAPRHTSWESAVVDWPKTRGHAFLRLYGDAVNGRLVEAWLPVDPPAERLLKTDLFDEAVGEGLVPLLRARARTMEAVDVSEAVLGAAGRRYPDLVATPADVRALPFADETFDAVVSSSTLDHFESLADVDAGLLELRRVLAPGGRLLLTLDNGSNPVVALRNTLPWRWLAAVKLVPCYVGATCGHEGLLRRLRALGMEVQRTAAVMHVPRVAALALGGLWPDARRPLGLVLAGERFGRLPTRYLTGQFVAVLAVRR